MIGSPAGTRVWLAPEFTDMRSGFNGLAAKVQTRAVKTGGNRSAKFGSPLLS